MTHVLKDCPATRDIWELVVPADKLSLFFSGDLLEWLVTNLQNHHQIHLGDVD